MSSRSMSSALLCAALLFGCGDEVLTEGLEQPFRVHDAQFVEGRLPGFPPLTAAQVEAGETAVRPRPTAATTEVSFLRPRLSGVAFSGWASLDAVSISAQIEGQGDGYWVLPAGPADPAVAESRVWRFVVDLHDSLPPGRHRLLVAATDANRKTGTQSSSTLCVNRLVPDNGNACDPKKPPPALVVSLEWDRPVDLDLIVVTPSGDVVDPLNPSIGVGADGKFDPNAPGSGAFDLDANQGCVIDGRQRENLVFQNSPLAGRYLVYVNLHNACGERSTRYAVSLHSRSVSDAALGTFSVVETARKSGALVAIQANGGTKLGTFVTEFIVQ